jgi:hypothetical protein
MEVRKKRPRGVQEEAQGFQVSPLNALSVSPCPRHAAALLRRAGRRPPPRGGGDLRLHDAQDR